jgi:hypothetical protein
MSGDEEYNKRATAMLYAYAVLLMIIAAVCVWLLMTMGR